MGMVRCSLRSQEQTFNTMKFFFEVKMRIINAVETVKIAKLQNYSK
jgi:hypothetical protein